MTKHRNRTSSSLTTDTLLHGDCLTHLRNIPSSSVDLICTDPPYGIGFMGKAWDTFPATKHRWPNISAGNANPARRRATAFQEFIHTVSEECLRVLKPGAFMFVTMTPRQDSLVRAVLAIEEAGFRIDFTSLYWTYASGFPKALNIAKAIGKRPSRSRSPKGMRLLEGSYGGFHPKPAVEVVIVAMKPLSEKRFADQALKNRKGITWLDDCRIPASGDSSGGRFPANLLVSDGVLNDGRMRTSSMGATRRTNAPGGIVGWNAERVGNFVPGYGDSGSYSRYFSLDAWSATLPFLIVPKASKREKNAGLETFPNKRQAGLPLRAAGGRKGGVGGDGSRTDRITTTRNIHPTVKPLQLMAYLITLASRPGDVVLDPFLGSGTTAMAAKLLGRRYIGIEREREYLDIARARISTVLRRKISG